MQCSGRLSKHYVLAGIIVTQYCRGPCIADQAEMN